MVGVTQRSRADRALRLVTDWCDGGSLQELLNDAFGGDEMEVRTDNIRLQLGARNILHPGATAGTIVGRVGNIDTTGFFINE